LANKRGEWTTLTLEKGARPKGHRQRVFGDPTMKMLRANYGKKEKKLTDKKKVERCVRKKPSRKRGGETNVTKMESNQNTNWYRKRGKVKCGRGKNKKNYAETEAHTSGEWKRPKTYF